MKPPSTSRRRATLPWIIALLMLAALVRGPCRSYLKRRAPRSPGLPPQRVLIREAVDGDTLRSRSGLTIRLLGIDAPELGRPFSLEARNFLASLTVGKVVRLRYEVEIRDRHGRLLAHVYAPSPNGEILVSEELLKHGLAELYLIPPNVEYRARLLNALRPAVLARKGIWSLPVEPAPYYVVGAWRFHRPQCPSVRDIPRPRVSRDRIALILEGKGRCRRCRP